MKTVTLYSYHIEFMEFITKKMEIIKFLAANPQVPTGYGNLTVSGTGESLVTLSYTSVARGLKLEVTTS